MDGINAEHKLQVWVIILDHHVALLHFTITQPLSTMYGFMSMQLQVKVPVKKKKLNKRYKYS